MRPNGVSAHVLGGVKGVANTLESTVTALTDPAGTLKGTVNLLAAGASGGNAAVASQIDDVLGTNALGTGAAISDGVSNAAEALASGDSIARGEVIGELASSTLGAKGLSILKITPKITAKSITTANGVEVTGFTKHGLNQKMNRGVKSVDVLDAVKKPLKTGEVKIDVEGRPSQRYTGSKAEVAVNPETGKVISVNPTSSKKAARLKRQQEEQ